VIFSRIRATVQVLPDHVEIVCTGPYSRAEALRVGREAYAEANRGSRDAVLVDVRGINGRVPTILDRFEFGVGLARNYLDFDPRVRLAVLGHEPMIHPERFGELVARNRGADARVFTDEAQARDWLLARPSGR
jgi:hypothetical protein